MLKFKIQTTNKFEKDVIKCVRRNFDIGLLKTIVSSLEETGTVPKKSREHPLSGNWAGHFEAHIKADWILIYTKDLDNEIIILIRTGTHSDLF
jgi:mRNA interferase YafQ